jgi:hypothetical protein
MKWKPASPEELARRKPAEPEKPAKPVKKPTKAKAKE